MTKLCTWRTCPSLSLLLLCCQKLKTAIEEKSAADAKHVADNPNNVILVFFLAAVVYVLICDAGSTERLLVLLCAGTCLTFGLKQRAISYLWSDACLWAQPATLQCSNHDLPSPPPPPSAHVIWVDEPIPQHVLKESKELSLQQALAKQTLQHHFEQKDMFSWIDWVRSDGNCGPDSLTLLSQSLLPTLTPALWLQDRATLSFMFRFRLFTWLAKNELTVANQSGATFQLLCEDERMETETWVEYCDRMKNDTFGEAEWFTNASLQAAAHLLERDICVTTANGGTVFESKYQALHPSSTRPCFFLANSNNNHYWPFGLSAAPFQDPFMIL